MQKYQSIISGTNGSVIRNVPVTVLKEDGSLAEIFMDREGQVQAPNPLVTDSRGVFYFYAKNGRYSLRTAADGVQITDADTVLLFDPDETVADGPIADAVRRAEDAAERAETALGDSGLQNLVQDAQDSAANAVQAVIDANQAVASIDAALIEAGEAKEAAQAAAQTASNAASGAQAVKDSLLTYSGTLSATPEWSAVPAHEDPDLDAQTQAALNRIEKLKDDQQLLKQRADKSVLSYPDYAAASAAAATLPDGQEVKIKADETHGGQESLYKKTASGLEYAGPTTAQEGVNIATEIEKVNTRDYTREFLWDLPIEFPDYQSILANYGMTNETGFLYPGSYAFDEDAREILIAYGGPVVEPMGTYMVVWDMDAGGYKGYFRTEASISEGVEIVGSGADRRLFTAGRQDGNLHEWAHPLTNHYQGGPLTLIATRALGIYNQFSRNPTTGAWAFEQNEPSVGQLIDRTTLLLTDKDFNPTGTLALDISQSSYVTPTSNAYSKYFPKRQGFALGLNCLATSHGASHDTGLQTQDPTFYQGCRVLSSRGEVLRDSITDPLAFKEVVHREVGGAKPARIENEGCKFLRDGSLTALYIYRTRWSTIPERTTGGILICREFAAKGVDFSEGGVQTMKGDSLRYEVGVFPRANGGYINPVTGAKFTSLNDVCDYLHYTNRKQFSIYTSSYTLNGFDGLPVPSGTFVSITNLNGLSFHVSLRSTAVGTSYDFFAQGGTVGGNNRTTIRMQPRVPHMLMDAGVAGTGAKLSRIFVPSYDSTGQNFLMLDLQSNAGSANVMIGGGSAAGRGVTSVQMFTSDTHGVGAGTLRWMVNSAGDFRPGTDNSYQIGYSDFRVKDLFLANAPTVSSDRRLKQQQRSLTMAEKAAAAEIRALPCAYKMTDAVQQKGSDNARWHYGVYAQDVIEVLERHGVDWTKCGFVCFDQWGDEYVEHEALYQDSEIIGADGLPLKTLIKAAWTEKVREAGERYSIRYQELSMFLLAASA